MALQENIAGKQGHQSSHETEAFRPVKTLICSIPTWQVVNRKNGEPGSHQFETWSAGVMERKHGDSGKLELEEWPTIKA